MAWEEWKRLKAEAATRKATRIQLNQAASGGGGGDCSGPDLTSSPRVKKAAAKEIQEVLMPGAARDGKYAVESTNTAIKEFGARDGGKVIACSRSVRLIILSRGQGFGVVA
ncbi:hypothetical protein LUW75_09705 [Streptomyces sp. MRC013]|uniref:hypothetical protein n=1 Tax=Streptomyces sp. MRC013 TaxID=2898276 RepID=UPI002025FCCC|nr:hypothetical protein [Streptomyces sp. MRC013]URM90219.1 hypothetical protein LUW75_09705 [Streptomyces sp. MRC013]